MNFKKWGLYILTAAALGLSACGGQTTVKKPEVSGIVVSQEYQGPQVEGDKTFVTLEGTGLENCVLNVSPSNSSVPFDDSLKATLSFGSELLPGNNILEAECDGVGSSTTLNLEEATASYNVTGISQGAVTSWVPTIESGSFGVSVTTNLPAERDVSYKIVLSWSDLTKQIVDDAFNDPSMTPFTFSQKPALEGVVSNTSSATFVYEIPTGVVDVSVEAYVTNSEGTHVLYSNGSVKIRPPVIKVFGYEDGVHIVENNGPDDADPASNVISKPYVVFILGDYSFYVAARNLQGDLLADATHSPNYKNNDAFVYVGQAWGEDYTEPVETRIIYEYTDPNTGDSMSAEYFLTFNFP